MKLTALLLLALNLAIAASAGFYLYLCEQAAARCDELEPVLAGTNEAFAATSREIEVVTEDRDRWARESAILETELRSLNDAIEAGSDASKWLVTMLSNIEPDFKALSADTEKLYSLQNSAFGRLQRRFVGVIRGPKAVGTIEQIDAAQATIRITEKDEAAVLEAGQVVTFLGH